MFIKFTLLFFEEILQANVRRQHEQERFEKTNFIFVSAFGSTNDLKLRSLSFAKTLSKSRRVECYTCSALSKKENKSLVPLSFLFQNILMKLCLNYGKNTANPCSLPDHTGRHT